MYEKVHSACHGLHSTPSTVTFLHMFSTAHTPNAIAVVSAEGIEASCRRRNRADAEGREAGVNTGVIEKGG